ncbi:DUF6171 family protein [Paenibacillus cookii]|jgi:hypothetical protein|uniref:Uncharacterized protein n=1 Tax=Paenibacillus cookii TaxID=157839 RepID=A0ABQ4LXF0_9BACL|nr:DUF6171 family protein [Paenibacillus cookii]GIO67960.1 hypothetical protein J21TS3_27810 [Paenibacillus cookii]
MQTAKRGACKGCGPEYQVNDEYIQRVLSHPMFSSEHCVPEEVYQQRLAICQACPKLQDGISCSVCGCIIPVAAKLKARGCPLPGGGLWGTADAE